ncbi:MAG: hypothetical protein JWO78_122 [Micavibrio sp.]|nr:hypothetical protein [Micavibrio sp.]
MIPKLIISLIIVLVGFLLYASTRANYFRVERSVRISATPQKIFSFLNNLRKGTEWSPWMDIDPNMEINFSGPESGVGATHEWSGNNKIGSGRMTIVESMPDEKVVLTLDFFKPFKAHNMAEMVLHPNDDGTTTLTWATYGPQSFIGKIMNLIFNCEKMIGPHFERGLAKLKALAET